MMRVESILSSLEGYLEYIGDIMRTSGGTMMHMG